MKRFVAVVFTFSTLWSLAAHAQPTHIEGLGSIDFPNSGNEAAQDPFYRAVLLMHSFEFTAAAEFFREAQAADPTFALAYWGEAMTYNHPLWKDKDLAAGRAVLERYAKEADGGSMDHRESMYMTAVTALYSEGTKTEQDHRYMNRMAELHAMHGEDGEARAFYALSILGSTDGDRDFATYMKAAALVDPLFNRNPLHPGAAHYLIHAFDDPTHAPLGLRAAEAYSDIAPGAAHAQHMTTHIFLALGQWDRVIENNTRAIATANEERARRGRREAACGHYTSWKHYALLQAAELEEAEAMMDACYARVLLDDHFGSEWSSFTGMRAAHIVALEDWTLNERWSIDLATLPEGRLVGAYAYSEALSAINMAKYDEVDQWRSQLPDTPGLFAVAGLELDGYLLFKQGNTEKGLELLREAATMEEALPIEFGPPRIAKPSHELLAEALVEVGEKEQAKTVYEIAESRTPGRRLLKRAMDLE